MKHAAAAVGLCSGSTIWPSLALRFFFPVRKDFFKVTTEALSKKCAPMSCECLERWRCSGIEPLSKRKLKFASALAAWSSWMFWGHGVMSIFKWSEERERERDAWVKMS